MTRLRRTSFERPDTARRVLLSYLEESERIRAAWFGPREGDSVTRRVAKRLFPAPLRMGPRRVATRFVRPRERRRAAALLGAQPIRLHLGSGNSPKRGWVNVDLASYPVELVWDLSRPLPLPAESVDSIFHEHLLEHLSLSQGLALCDESYRLLRPGGILRIGVPDAEASTRSYIEESARFRESARPERRPPLLVLQELFYYPGHKTMYDFELLALLLRGAGFSSVNRCRFGESELDPAPDSEHRRGETMYVEAVK